MTLNDEIKEKITSLSNKIIIKNDWEPFADFLSEQFEWIGSKIDWSKTI